MQLTAVADNIYVFKNTAPMYKSAIFKQLLPHMIQLDMIHRQDRSELEYIIVLQDLRQGHCSNETLKFIENNLMRVLPNPENHPVVQMCFT